MTTEAGRELKGAFDGKGLRVAVCTARFNDLITSRLVEGCRNALAQHGVKGADVHWAEVPGSRELPVACKALAQSGRYDVVIALGCVIRGETAHFELVAHETSRGLGQAAVETGVPIIFGVLATENLEQAMDRAGGKMGNAGWNAAVSAVETANLLERIAKRTFEPGDTPGPPGESGDTPGPPGEPGDTPGPPGDPGSIPGPPQSDG